MKNPKNKDFNKSTADVEKLYADAYKLYETEKFTESSAMIDKAIADHPKDALIPKFYLLNAYNAGKNAGKEIMILQLEQIVLNYAKTPEGLKAKELLKYLKSDTKLELTDDTGNTISPILQQNSTPEEAAKVQIQNTEVPERNNPAPVSGPGKPEQQGTVGIQPPSNGEQQEMKPIKKK